MGNPRHFISRGVAIIKPAYKFSKEAYRKIISFTAYNIGYPFGKFLAEVENRTLFFSLWWKEVDEDNAKRLMEASGDYRYYLEAMRLYKPHTLSEPEEKIVNIKNVTGSNALINLYDSITNRYTFKMMVNGPARNHHQN